MPYLDAYTPQGALSLSAERELLTKLTELLIEHEGVDPANERGRPLAWIFTPWRAPKGGGRKDVRQGWRAALRRGSI